MFPPFSSCILVKQTLCAQVWFCEEQWERGGDNAVQCRSCLCHLCSQCHCQVTIFKNHFFLQISKALTSIQTGIASSAFTPAPPQSRTSQLESTTTAFERKMNKMQCFLTWLLLCTAAFTLMSVEIASDWIKAIGKRPTREDAEVHEQPETSTLDASARTA